MTKEQEAHLARIKNSTSKLMDTKYRKGQDEHGGDLLDLSALQLVDAGIDEAIDQIVYLQSVREKLVGQR